MREKNKEEFLGKENRNILANYMAGLGSGATKLNRKLDSAPIQDVPKRDTVSRLTLQESLAKNRPDFIVKAAYRTQRLNEMRLMRLEYEEQVINTSFKVLNSVPFLIFIQKLSKTVEMFETFFIQRIIVQIKNFKKAKSLKIEVNFEKLRI